MICESWIHQLESPGQPRGLWQCSHNPPRWVWHECFARIVLYVMLTLYMYQIVSKVKGLSDDSYSEMYGEREDSDSQFGVCQNTAGLSHPLGFTFTGTWMGCWNVADSG